MRLSPVDDIKAVVLSSYGVCALGATTVACAPRAWGQTGFEDLRLTPVTGLSAPSALWRSLRGYFALDGSRIMTWEEKGEPAPHLWSSLAAGDAAYPDPGGGWFLFRGGTLLRTPDGPWPLRYEAGAPPSEIVQDYAVVHGDVVWLERGY
jgi:hypothetical protein